MISGRMRFSLYSTFFGIYLWNHSDTKTTPNSVSSDMMDWEEPSSVSPSPGKSNVPPATFVSSSFRPPHHTSSTISSMHTSQLAETVVHATIPPSSTPSSTIPQHSKSILQPTTNFVPTLVRANHSAVSSPAQALPKGPLSIHSTTLPALQSTFRSSHKNTCLISSNISTVASTNVTTNATSGFRAQHSSASAVAVPKKQKQQKQKTEVRREKR
jgi:hypothetical protein